MLFIDTHHKNQSLFLPSCLVHLPFHSHPQPPELFFKSYTCTHIQKAYLHVSPTNLYLFSFTLTHSTLGWMNLWVLRVLGDLDDHYRGLARVTYSTVGVARKRYFFAQWPWVLSIGQNLQPFTSNGDYPKEWKILEWDEKPQTTKIYVKMNKIK